MKQVIPSFLDYLKKKVDLFTYFPNETEGLYFGRELNRYGLSAFQNIPVDIQIRLIKTYHFVYLESRAY